MSSTQLESRPETSVVLHKRGPTGVVTGPTLERPASSLAENVQKTMGGFYSVQKGLLGNKRVPNAFYDKFKQGKSLFRAECENMRQILQSSYRHASDYAVSSQRAPDDRSISAKRCFLSAKAVHRDVQEIYQRYVKLTEDFKTQRSALVSYLTKNAQSQSSSTPTMSEDVDDPVTTLFSAFDAVQSSLRDIQAFWEHHVGFLSLLVNRQTNFPAPGEEAKATFELWTRCQTALLQSSSSISESADAMSVEPVATPLTRYPTRRITHPITERDRPLLNPTEGANRSVVSLKPGAGAGKTKDKKGFFSYIRRLVSGSLRR